MAVGEIAAQTVAAGQSVTIDVSSYFSDPDGDALSYAAIIGGRGLGVRQQRASVRLPQQR